MNYSKERTCRIGRAAIDRKKIDHLLKTTAAYSATPDRDVAMLLVLYGFGLTTVELSTIPISSYIDEGGSIRVRSVVPAGISHNKQERPLYWTNNRVVSAMDKYLSYRLEQEHGLGKSGAYRGLDSASPIFLTEKGNSYAITTRVLASGNESVTNNALGAAIGRLHDRAGLVGVNAQDARRTWAIMQYRKGICLEHIALLLGHKSISTTRRLIAGEKVEYADIVASAI